MTLSETGERVVGLKLSSPPPPKVSNPCRVITALRRITASGGSPCPVTTTDQAALRLNVQPIKNKKEFAETLVVQWLRLHTSSAGGSGLILGQGTRFRMLQLRPSTAK